jgi:energy-coupling factor transport system substrate-specific component/cob(I)alamin adenosyltransferase
MKTVKDVVVIAFLSAILTVGKMSLSAVPNVEVVSFLFILYTVVFGWRYSLFTSIVFATTEILIWGLGIWTIGYYLIWPLLVLLTALLPNRWQTIWGYTILSGLFGLFFGLFFAIYTAPILNVSIWLYWINGLMFDVIHMVGNVSVMILLYVPARRGLEFVQERIER